MSEEVRDSGTDRRAADDHDVKGLRTHLASDSGMRDASRLGLTRVEEGDRMTIRPRRSVLYMPGSNARALEKAKTLPVDGVILDLEDAVAPDAKAMARDQVVAAVKAGGFGPREVFIRTNGFDTEWFAADLTAAASAAPDAILIPKISNSDQLELIAQRLLSMHANHRVRIWAMIETPTAIFNVREIAAAAKDAETR